MGRNITVSFAFFLMLFSCKYHSSDSRVKVNSSPSKCSVYIAPSLNDEFAAAEDPFKSFITTADFCEAQGVELSRFYHALLAHGCNFTQKFFGKSTDSLVGRSFVSEIGFFGFGDEKVHGRFVDKWHCAFDDNLPEDIKKFARAVYVAGINAQLTNYEIIAFDEKNQQMNFYTQIEGPDGLAHFVFNGTSFRQARSEESQAGYTNSHPCTKCHVSGALLLKELHNPWVNWHGTENAMYDLDELQKAMFPEEADFPKAVTTWHTRDVAALEIDVGLSQEKINTKFLDLAREGKSVQIMGQDLTVPITLEQILTPLFCERDLNIAADRIMGFTEHSIKSEQFLKQELFLNHLLLPYADPNDSSRSRIYITNPDPNIPRLRVGQDADRFLTSLNTAQVSYKPVIANFLRYWPDAFVEYLKSEKLSLPAASHSQSEYNKHLGRVGIFVPTRSHSDDMFITQAIQSGVFSENFARSALMVDFANPLFSQPRCAILKALPEAVRQASYQSILETGKNTTKSLEDLVTSELEKLAHKNANIHAFLKNLTDGEDVHVKRIMNYLQACAQIQSNPEAKISKDYNEKLRKFLRAKWQNAFLHHEQFALEEFNLPLFYEGDRLFKHEFIDELTYGMTETCTFNF